MYISPDADGALLVRVASGDRAALYGRYVMVALGVARGVRHHIR